MPFGLEQGTGSPRSFAGCSRYKKKDTKQLVSFFIWSKPCV